VTDDSEPVPKLPRGRGIRLNGPEMFRILLTGAMLVAVLILAKPCGSAVSGFLMKFDNTRTGSAASHAGSGSGASAPSMTGLPGSAGDYVELHPGMTDEEVRQAIEKAKAKRAGSAAP
jgi:hypothetical protein